MRLPHILALLIALTACGAGVPADLRQDIDARVAPVQDVNRETLLTRAYAILDDSTLVVRRVNDSGGDEEPGSDIVTEYRAPNGGAVRRITLSSFGEEHDYETTYLFRDDGQVFGIFAAQRMSPAMISTERWDTLLVWDGQLLYQGHGSRVESPELVVDTTPQSLAQLLQELERAMKK
jgi:hypothetical protein